MNKSKPFIVKPKQYFTPLINVLDPYKISPGDVYSFTINLSDLYTGIEQSQMAYKYFLKKFVIPYAKFELYPDVSKKARYHMHGIIYFESYKNIMDFYINTISQLNGETKICSMEIDTITDNEKWYTYCKKSLPLFEGYDLKYTHLHQCIKKAEPTHLRDQFSMSIDDDEITQLLG